MTSFENAEPPNKRQRTTSDLEEEEENRSVSQSQASSVPEADDAIVTTGSIVCCESNSVTVSPSKATEEALADEDQMHLGCKDADAKSEATRRSTRLRVLSTRLLDAKVDEVRRSTNPKKTPRIGAKGTNELPKSTSDEIEKSDSSVVVENENAVEGPLVEELSIEPTASHSTIPDPVPPAPDSTEPTASNSSILDPASNKTEEDRQRSTEPPPTTPNEAVINADVTSLSPRSARQRTVSVVSSGIVEVVNDGDEAEETEEEVIDVEKRVDSIKSFDSFVIGSKPLVDRISRISNPAPRCQVRQRSRHHREDAILNVDVDDVLDVVSGPLPLCPPKPTPPPPAMIGRALGNYNCERPPPRAAPLLVAGPPRRNDGSSMLQTTFWGQKHFPKNKITTVSSHLDGASIQSVGVTGTIAQKSTSRVALTSNGTPSMRQSTLHQGGARDAPEEGRTVPNQHPAQPVKGAAATEPFELMTDRGKVTLEPVTVNMSDADGSISSKEMLAIIDQNGRPLGYGNLDEEGNLVQEIDCDELGGNVEIVEQEIHDKKDHAQPQMVESSSSGERTKRTNSNREIRKEHADDGSDEDGPPELDPEDGAPIDEVMFNEQQRMEEAQTHQVHYLDEDDPQLTEHGTYVDGDGVEYMEDDGMSHHQHQLFDARTVEFNFLDHKNICCGLCGEIVPYDLLVNEHLPQIHPELLGEGATDLEEIPYEVWLRDKLHFEKKAMETGFRASSYQAGASLFNSHHMPRNTRKVSQIRVCPAEMPLQQLEECLRKKMIEKMGRRVRVSLVDKLHAKCGECGSILSLNKKFEISHMVRHFNAWHPTSHRCAGKWLSKIPQPGMGKPLNMQDFAVVDIAVEAQESLQCIWCGMFMAKDSLAMHFFEVHAEEIEVPKCRLCIEELVVNARLQEQFGEDFEVTMPDESHYESRKLGLKKFSSELVLQKAIEKHISGKGDEGVPNDDSDASRRRINNSRMHYGKRSKPKRNFVMPSYRQAIPQNSPYVEALSSTQWQCRKCGFIIMAAVMSSGCISHYKKEHPDELDNLRYELCKTRLEKISDGCMEFVHASLIECLMCQVAFALHKPYNMCRAIRHLKAKHSDMMPENQRAVVVESELKEVTLERRELVREEEEELQEDEDVETQQLSEEQLERFRLEYSHLDFDEVRFVQMPDGEPIYLLMKEGEEVEMVDAEKHHMVESEQVGEGEEMYEVVEEPIGQYDHLELVVKEGEETKASHDFDHIVQSDEDEDAMAEQYNDDEAAPMPKEDGAVGRRLYSVDKYEEMQMTQSLRPEPVGYRRRAIHLAGEGQILEYFAPDECAVAPSDENMEIIERREIEENGETADTNGGHIENATTTVAGAQNVF